MTLWLASMIERWNSGVEPRLVGRVSFRVGGFHLSKDCVDHLEVRIGGETCGAFGGEPFHVAAKRDVVEHSLVMVAKELDKRRREGGAEDVSDKNPRSRF